MNGGTLTTAGNLVFYGTADGWLFAHAANDGVQLWKFDVGGPAATPITYKLEGTQYVTMIVGSRRSVSQGRVLTFAVNRAR